MQCGFWKSIHQDDLRPFPDTFPSYLDMHLTPVSELIQPRNQHSDKKHLNVTKVFFDCVKPALSLLQDEENDNLRALDRIKLISNLEELLEEHLRKSELSIPKFRLYITDVENHNSNNA